MDDNTFLWCLVGVGLMWSAMVWLLFGGGA